MSWSVCSELPAGSILEVEPGVYSLSPEALCVAVAREVGCIQAFALAQELCSKISLSDRGKYLNHPYQTRAIARPSTAAAPARLSSAEAAAIVARVW